MRWLLSLAFLVLATSAVGGHLVALWDSDLRVIASPDTDLATLRKALNHLGAVEEPSDFWVRIVSNAQYSPTHRRLCLYALFQRHAVGARLDSFFASPAAAWFKEEQVRDATTFSKLPVKRPDGQSIFMLRPELPPGNDSAIYLRLAGMVTIEEFFALILGKAQDPRVRILEVAINDVPD